MEKKEIYKVQQHFEAKPWAINDLLCVKDVVFAASGMCSCSELKYETWLCFFSPFFYLFLVYNTDAPHLQPF